MDVIVTANGNLRMIYAESIDAQALGTVEIRRGSHVEPTAAGQWTADLSPVDGPCLGPFARAVTCWPLSANLVTAALADKLKGLAGKGVCPPHGPVSTRGSSPRFSFYPAPLTRLGSGVIHHSPTNPGNQSCLHDLQLV